MCILNLDFDPVLNKIGSFEGIDLKSSLLEFEVFFVFL